MQLSLQEAMQILGKTRRQVLYMIEQGRLPARKVGSRWVIERADVQVDEAVQQRTTQKQARFKAVIEDALTPGQERRYTLRDLKAVQVATPIYREMAARGEDWAKRRRICVRAWINWRWGVTATTGRKKPWPTAPRAMRPVWPPWSCCCIPMPAGRRLAGRH